MPGRSVLYVLARERPMDMIPPICELARRCIQMKNPMIRNTGRSRNSRLCHWLGSTVTNLTPFSVISWRSASGGWVGPVLVNLVPAFSSPAMSPVLLSNWVLAPLTSLPRSLVMKSP